MKQYRLLSYTNKLITMNYQQFLLYSERKVIIYRKLTVLNTAFYDFLSYRGGGGIFYLTPQNTMLKLFNWFEIWYT